jgi:Na+/H+ antiporter NhaD/arsenite permease-like protein
MWYAVAIFFLAYLIIATGRLHKTIAAILGGTVLVALGGIPAKNVYSHIDLNVIFLLLGMMLLVHALAQTGFFQWLAISLAKASGGSPIKILLALFLTTAVLSALLDNVTTIILIAPVTILITDQLEVAPVPFLILEAIASNIGGTGTLIGDPPNILIGSHADLSFNQFVLNLGPVALLSLGVTVLAVWLMFRNSLRVPEDIRARVRESDPAGAITDRKGLIRIGVVVLLVLVGFTLHGVLEVPVGIVALLGAMLALILSGEDVHDAFQAVEWPTLMFFVGLFLLVGGLEEKGVLEWVAEHVVTLTRGHFFLTALFILWGSAAASAVVDNIPFVAAMIPVIAHLVPEIAGQMGIEESVQIHRLVGEPLWWSLALGACLGGNATLVGASANVVMAGVAEKHGHHVSFGRFALYGLPAVLVSLLISSAYIYLRYFAFAAIDSP